MSPRQEFDADLAPITTSLTQPIAPSELFNLMMGRIDEVIAEAMEQNHPQAVMNAVQTLLTARRSSGVGLAKCLYFLAGRWLAFGMEDEFKERAYQEWGIDPTYCGRLILVGDMLANGNIPEDAAEKLYRRPVRDLIMLANAWKQVQRRFLFPQWRKFANATDTADLRGKIDTVLEREPRASRLRITLKRDGTLTAITGDGEIEEFGFLNVDLALESPTVEKAINRVVGAAGIEYDFEDVL